jgi:hypothetical protein
VRQISNQLSRSNTLASTLSDKQEMAHDTETLVSGDGRPKVIAPTEEIDPQTGWPNTPKCPEGYKRCPVCKTAILQKDKPKTSDGKDAHVPDIYKQLLPVPSPPLKQHKDFQHCLPPTKPIYKHFSLFTAGSIEMGAAIFWQKNLAAQLKDLPITVCNPRRGKWNPNVHAKKEDPTFHDQVKWELDALASADVIVFFFDCNTSSPVTLLELGLYASSGKILVCCDQRYWRQGNVDAVCERYNIPYVQSYDKLIPALKEFMKLKGLDLDENNNYIGKPKVIKKTAHDSEAKEEKPWWFKYQDSEDDLRAKLPTAELNERLETQAKKAGEEERRKSLSDDERAAEDAVRLKLSNEEAVRDAKAALIEAEV